MDGDGRRPRVENEAAPGDPTDTAEDVDPEVKRRVTCAPVQVQHQVLGGIVPPPGLLPSSGDILRFCARLWLARIGESE